MSTPFRYAAKQGIDRVLYNKGMIKGSRQNEGSLDHNKDEFDKNFDAVKFPKAKETSAERREREKKEFLRLNLIASWDTEVDGDIEDANLDEIVDNTYARCGGLDY